MIEEEDEIPPAPEPGELRLNVFWPVLLLGISLLLLLGWEIWVGAATRRSALQLQDQQLRVVEQSKQAQQNLEKLVRGLVQLAKSDEEAQRLVNKFQIKITPPSPGTSASPSPDD